MKYFTIEELTKTSIKVNNMPNEEQVNNLKYLVENLLDPAREALNMPINVNSGFRNSEVNKRVGGVPTSQHTKGEAADLSCSDNAKLFEYFKTKTFDQLIWEKGNSIQPAWVHISLKRNGVNRQQIIKIK